VLSPSRLRLGKEQEAAARDYNFQGTRGGFFSDLTEKKLKEEEKKGEIRRKTQATLSPNRRRQQGNGGSGCDCRTDLTEKVRQTDTVLLPHPQTTTPPPPKTPPQPKNPPPPTHPTPKNPKPPPPPPKKPPPNPKNQTPPPTQTTPPPAIKTSVHSLMMQKRDKQGFAWSMAFRGRTALL